MKRFHPILAALAVSTIGVTASTIGAGTPAFAGSQTDIVGPAGSQAFGEQTLVLTNGNLVVVDTGFDKAGVADVGAVYLYSGATHQLISTLTGSTAGDMVGLSGIHEVGNSNFVVQSPFWTNATGAPVSKVGAVTWVNGTTGLNGVVDPANSLFGTTAGDDVGAFLAVLSNGNYVVGSPFLHVGASVNVGAATWGAGNAPTAGAVSVANSLVSTSANDFFGGQLTPLTNGNFVVTAPFWDDPSHATVDAGVATWGNGSTAGPRTVGTVSTANSLWGAATDNWVGGGMALALTNGNYVVLSPAWDLGATQNVGATTLGDGATGTIGFVAASNSLHGTTAGDLVGDDRSKALSNGNYVITSSNWNNGGTKVKAGAATWRSGTAFGVGEAVSTANSVFGADANDLVGSAGVTALTNGNYVVQSDRWDNGAALDVGAATWVGGGAAAAMAVTPANSLIGTTTNDNVGLDVTALINGNYVVQSNRWDNGAVDRAGAATWGSGSGGVSGVVSPANSLVGSKANDQIALSVVPLTNGNYVVVSQLWNSSRGAVTWGSGAGGLAGPITDANSLIGDVAGDRIGDASARALANGNYVVGSPLWNRGAIVDAGAATFADGATGTVGHVSPSNSLVGSATADQVGSFLESLPDSSYVASSRRTNGADVEAGSATFGLPAGVRGEMSSTNTVFGTVAMGAVAVADHYLGDGSVVVSRSSSNLITLYRPDRSTPMFQIPDDVTAVALPGATSTVVDYPVPTASDDVGIPTVACTPPPGSAFPIGSTVVTCTATNTEGLTATTTFTVTVGNDYVPLAPARLADTRSDGVTVDGLFAGTGLRSAGTTLQLHVAGRGGVPADAVAVALNVTVTEATAAGFLTAYPCDQARPTASNLNYSNGSTIPNAVLSKLATSGPAAGDVCIYVQQAVHVVVDVNGFFPPTTSYHPMNPARLLDTRSDSPTVDGMQQGGGAAAAGGVTAITITGRAGIPADAAGVVLNVTVTEPAAAGYATVYPCGGEPPTASNLNYAPDQTIPNLVVAKVGTSGPSTGTVCIFTQSATHLVVDVLGYFPADTTFAALVPARLLDTRPAAETIDGIAAGSGAVPLGTVTVVHVLGRGGVPASATTAVLNVTVTEPEAAGFLTAYPCGIAPPLASNVNYTAGQTVPNAVLTRIGTGGDVCLFNSQPTHLVVDVNGFFP